MPNTLHGAIRTSSASWIFAAAEFREVAQLASKRLHAINITTNFASFEVIPRAIADILINNPSQSDLKFVSELISSKGFSELNWTFTTLRAWALCLSILEKNDWGSSEIKSFFAPKLAKIFRETYLLNKKNENLNGWMLANKISIAEYGHFSRKMYMKYVTLSKFKNIFNWSFSKNDSDVESIFSVQNKCIKFYE